MLVSPTQERLPSLQRVRGRVKLKVPTSGGHREGANIDPTVLPSPNTQFDDTFHTLVSSAMSLEIKQQTNCPTFTLDVQGKGLPSLLDSGSMVTLIWEGYFEKNILPCVKNILLGSSLKLIHYSSFLQQIIAQCQFHGIWKLTLNFLVSQYHMLGFSLSKIQTLF